MKTILLDIDGTLLRTQGAGLKAILEVMANRYQIETLPDVITHGRTDNGIWQEVFQKLDLSIPSCFGDLIDEYCRKLDRILTTAPGHLMPGVKPLLEALSTTPNVSLGVLTGNAKRAAEIKLSRFDLAKYVLPFGGYGDEFDERDRVAQTAYDSAQQFLQNEFNPQDVWVVGDTLADIQCARAINAKVLAVATGGATYQELAAAEPDSLLPDFSDLDQSIQAIFSI